MPFNLRKLLKLYFIIGSFNLRSWLVSDKHRFNTFPTIIHFPVYVYIDYPTITHIAHACIEKAFSQKK